MLDILSSNKESILNQLKRFDENLRQLIRDLEEENIGEVATRLQTAKLRYETYLESRWNMLGQVQSKDVDE